MTHNEDSALSFSQTLAKINETLTRSQSAVEAALGSVASPARRQQSLAKLLIEEDEGAYEVARYEKERSSDTVRCHFDIASSPSPLPDSVSLLHREKSLLEAQIRDLAARLKTEEREKAVLASSVQQLRARIKELEECNSGRVNKVTRSQRELELERKVAALQQRLADADKSSRSPQVAELKATIDRLTRENQHLESLLAGSGQVPLFAPVAESPIDMFQGSVQNHSRSSHCSYDSRFTRTVATNRSDLQRPEVDLGRFEAEVRRNTSKIELLEKQIQQAAGLFTGLRLELGKTKDAKDRLVSAFQGVKTRGERPKSSTSRREPSKKKGKKSKVCSMEEPVLAPTALTVVHEITLEDILFNLDKKTTQRSKRAVGIEELERVVSELSRKEEDCQPQVEAVELRFQPVMRTLQEECEDDWEPKPLAHTPIPQVPIDHTAELPQTSADTDLPQHLRKLASEESIEPSKPVILELSQTIPISIHSDQHSPAASQIVKLAQIDVRSQSPRPQLQLSFKSLGVTIPPVIRTPQPVATTLVKIASIDVPPSDSESSLVVVSRLGTVEVQPTETVNDTVDEETGMELVAEDRGVQGDSPSLEIARLEAISAVHASSPPSERLRITTLEGISAVQETETPKFESRKCPIVEEGNVQSAERTVEDGEEPKADSLLRMVPVPSAALDPSESLSLEASSAYATVPIQESASDHEDAEVPVNRALRHSMEPKPPSALRELEPIVARSPAKRKLKPRVFFVNPILRHLEGSTPVPFPPPQRRRMFAVKKELLPDDSPYRAESPMSLPPLFTTEVSRAFTGIKAVTSARKTLSLQVMKYSAAHINYESSLLEKPFSPFRCTKVMPLDSGSPVKKGLRTKESGLAGSRGSQQSSRADCTLRSETESPPGRRSIDSEKHGYFRRF